MMRFRTVFSSSFQRILLLSVALSVLTACSLPALQDRIPSTALSTEEALHTPIGAALKPLAQEHPELSGIRSLADPHDAFAARALLARVAEKTIDVQYYIWRADTTGYMLLNSLYEAANRGVRIRLLLDDNGIDKLDTQLALLHQHRNIEVRVFNPFPFRTVKRLGYVFDFKRLNHRMHNKSFTIDNTVTIVGGRNIGDEYFGATDQVLFADLDVIAMGKVVDDVSVDFDRYWDSPLSYPINQIVTLRSHQTLDQLDLNALIQSNPDRAKEYFEVVRQAEIIQDLVERKLEVEWVKTEIVSDDPAKALGQASPEQLLTYQLQHAVGTPEFTLDLISPYFVPTKTGVQSFSVLADNPNLTIRILTNSYEATDVGAVHAGYMKRRKSILHSGIELYELKSNSSGNLQKIGKNSFGSSGSSLHAKTFSIDNKRVFIGSFNFDPRSAHLNTELGFVIHSPTLAKDISALFDNQIPYESYQVVLNDKNKVHWIEREDEYNVPQIHDTEPGTSFFSRWWLQFISKLPIEWLL